MFAHDFKLGHTFWNKYHKAVPGPSECIMPGLYDDEPDRYRDENSDHEIKRHLPRFSIIILLRDTLR